MTQVILPKNYYSSLLALDDIPSSPLSPKQENQQKMISAMACTAAPVVDTEADTEKGPEIRYTNRYRERLFFANQLLP